MNLDQRLVDIEIKLTAQEDLVQELNQQIYLQQRQIDELRALCTALVKRLEASHDEPGSDPYTDERPPHY